MRPRVPLLAAGLALGLGLNAAPAPAVKSTTSADRIWTSPEYKTLAVSSIAMLPVVMHVDDADQRKMIETALAPALRPSGHRWVSPYIARDQLLRAGGDELLRSLREKILKSPRVDSLDAPLLARTLRTRALFTVRADRMERVEIELGQSGRPSTTVQLQAALVDSTGRLLWSANSTERLEGPEQEASGNLISVRPGSLNNVASGLTTAPPKFQEVLLKLAQRWGEEFPKRAAADTTGAKP